MRADRSLLAGLFLVCLANMLLEIVVTRLFSATMFYHFSFLAVALALFGVAASGVYVFVAGDRLGVDRRSHWSRRRCSRAWAPRAGCGSPQARRSSWPTSRCDPPRSDDQGHQICKRSWVHRTNDDDGSPTGASPLLV